MIAAITAAIVIAAAVAVPLLLTPSAAPGPTSGPTGIAASDAVPTGRPATPSSSFPPPAVIPSARPSATPSGILPSATASSVPTSPGRGQVGIEARRIRIERLKIDLPIVEGDGVDAPLFKAAHYPGTAWPGGGSNIYIYGHAQEGMFLSLWDARVGDEIVLSLVDGREARYSIARVIPEARWNDLSLVGPTATEQLTVQTSTSNTATAPRFVVIAHPTT